jgi:hypothetical protein
MRDWRATVVIAGIIIIGAVVIVIDAIRNQP